MRAHESAHAAAGGAYTGAPTFRFAVGPDGRQYAVSGEVRIDSSPVAGDPEATIRKMQQIRAAALAPSDPSGQDLSVAAQATQLETQARQELNQQRRQEQEELRGGNSNQSLLDAYRNDARSPAVGEILHLEI